MPTLPALGTAVFNNTGTGASDTLNLAGVVVDTALEGSALFVAFAIRNLGAASVSSVVWDAAGVNEAMTLVAEAAGDTDLTTHVYGHLAPTPKTATATVTLSTGKRFAGVAVPVSGIRKNIAAPSSLTSTTANGTSQLAAASQATTADHLVLDVVGKRRDDGSAENPVSNGTEIGETATSNATADNNVRLGLAWRTATGASVSHEWSWAVSTDRDWSIVVWGIPFPQVVGKVHQQVRHSKLMGLVR